MWAWAGWRGGPDSTAGVPAGRLRYLAWLGGAEGRIRVFGLAPGWTAGRDLPAPSGRTFHELHSSRQTKIG